MRRTELSFTKEEESRERFLEVQDQMMQLTDLGEQFCDILYAIEVLDNQNFNKLKFLNQQITTRLKYIEDNYFK